jgi:quinol monooxygenase YgiN
VDRGVIVVVGTISFPPDALEAARPHMAALVAATRAEDGCIHYAFGEAVGEAGIICIGEAWRDAEALAAHAASGHMAAWREAAAALEAHDRDLTAYEADRPRKL